MIPCSIRAKYLVFLEKIENKTLFCTGNAYIMQNTGQEKNARVLSGS